MRNAIRNWFFTVVVIFVLYVGVSVMFFNHADYLLLGMPPLIFWFTLVPIVTPCLLGILYLSDKKNNPQWREGGH